MWISFRCKSGGVVDHFWVQFNTQVGATTVMPIQTARIKKMAGLHPAISAFEGLQKSRIEKTDSNQHRVCQKFPLLKIVLNSVEA